MKKEYDDGIYEGGINLLTKKRSGYGVMHYNDGSIYRGKWQNDMYNGEGTYVSASDFVRKGFFVDGKLEGKGEEKTSHWHRISEYKNDKAHGYGKEIMQDNSCFEGLFEEGRRKKGKIFTAEGKLFFEGTFFRPEGVFFVNIIGQPYVDKFCGYGTMYFEDRKYTGKIYGGYPNGLGYQEWYDGGSYYGTFKDGKRTGFGVMEFSDFGCAIGEWEESTLNGKGIMIVDPYYVAEGNFVDQEPHGHAIYRINSAGSHYEGEMKNGFYDGEGIFYYYDGGYKKGVWRDDAINGKAELEYNDGTRYYGLFQDGIEQGIGKTVYLDGTVSIDYWQNGEPIANLDSALYYDEETDSKYDSEIEKYFEDIIGMDSVKEDLNAIYKRFQIDLLRNKNIGIELSNIGLNFIITGNPGTGKTTVARIIGHMLYELGLISEDVLVEVDRSTLVSEYIGGTEANMRKAIDSANGGVLFIDEAYNLYKKGDEKDFGKEALDTLLKDMEDNRGQYSVIIAGYKDDIDEMLREVNPGFRSRFDYLIDIPDYTNEELVKIVVNMAMQKQMFINANAKQSILNAIDKEKIDHTFDNARFARRLLGKAIENQAVRISKMDRDPTSVELLILESSDFGGRSDDGKNQVVNHSGDSLEKLNSLIGLDGVKEQINRIIQTVKVHKEMEKRGINTVSTNIPLNFAFIGNPGTGKTTVARLFGKIYQSLGLLKRGDIYVECTRADLVGQYMGSTAIKVKEAVSRAIGGVLFIDEVYSLYQGDNDEFGKEAIDTLVAEIENNRDKLAVIIAGYTDKTMEFLAINPGLKSRIDTIIEFEDYTAEELVQILKYELTDRGYVIGFNEHNALKLISTYMERNDFGNARGVRNICDLIVSEHNKRLNTMDISSVPDEEFIRITDEDILKLV